MAHAVVIRLKELGLPEELDETLGTMSTDLGDIWGSQRNFAERLKDMVEGDANWNAIGDCLVDLKAAVDHIAVHVDSVREPIERLAEYAYEQAGE